MTANEYHEDIERAIQGLLDEHGMQLNRIDTCWTEPHSGGGKLIGLVLETTKRLLGAPNNMRKEEEMSEHKTEWLPPGTAPRTPGVKIIAQFGCPYAQIATWSGSMNGWAVAQVNTGIYGGKYSDPYYETEYEPDSSLIAWLPMPEV